MVDTLDIDRAPAHEKMKEEEESDNHIPAPPERSAWSVYLKPHWLTILLNNNKLIYGLVITLWYLVQFVGCVAVINLYSDSDRLTPCDTTGPLADGEESSKVFDTPLLFLAIWHIIEWIRTTVLLTVVCIGVNWVIFWYATALNTLFGLVVYALVHMSYFDEDGKKCAEVQEYRAQWLLIEIIAFWALFFLFAFPFVFTCCLGKDRADKTLAKACEKDDEFEE